MLKSKEELMFDVVVDLMAGNLNTVLSLNDLLGMVDLSKGKVYTSEEVFRIIQSIQGMVECDLESAKLVAISHGVFHQIAEKLEVLFEDVLNKEVQ